MNFSIKKCLYSRIQSDRKNKNFTVLIINPMNTQMSTNFLHECKGTKIRSCYQTTVNQGTSNGAGQKYNSKTNSYVN